MEGNQGVFDKPNQFLKLTGEVVFSDKKEFSFHTSEATMDFKKKIILGKHKVSGKKENSTIFSEGLILMLSLIVRLFLLNCSL